MLSFLRRLFLLPKDFLVFFSSFFVSSYAEFCTFSFCLKFLEISFSFILSCFFGSSASRLFYFAPPAVGFFKLPAFISLRFSSASPQFFIMNPYVCDALQDVGCIIDFKGFYVDKKYLVKEMGVCFTYKEDLRSLTFSVGRSEDLSPDQLWSVNWLSTNFHGLKYETEFGDYDQSTVPGLLVALVAECDREAKKPVVAFRGMPAEHSVLTGCGMKCLDLTNIGCPTFDELFDGQVFGIPYCHLHDSLSAGKVAPCPQLVCAYYKRWCQRALKVV